MEQRETEVTQDPMAVQVCLDQLAPSASQALQETLVFQEK